MATTGEHPGCSAGPGEPGGVAADAADDAAETVLLPVADNALILPRLAALSAAGIEYRVVNDGERWCVVVASALADRAQTELERYEEVNRNWPPPAPQRPDSAVRPAVMLASMTASASLLGFFRWTGAFERGNPFFAAGALDRALFQGGQWWRPVTALTLHSDPAHVLGNVCCCFFFGLALGQALGWGMSWFLLVLSGVIGNVLAGFYGAPSVVSAGASTASFGALGVLAVQQVGRRWLWRAAGEDAGQTWVPLVAGAGLLAFLGTGPNADLSAHVFGFLAGGFLGAVAFPLVDRRPHPDVQIVSAALTVGLVTVAWRAAVAASGSA